MTIEIKITAEHGAEALSKMMALLGGMGGIHLRAPGPRDMEEIHSLRTPAAAPNDDEPELPFPIYASECEAGVAENKVLTPSRAAEIERAKTEAAAKEEPPAIRYHGQASGGKRRTKAEMAADEEATKLMEAAGVTVEQFNGALKKTLGDWDAVMADLRAVVEGKAEEPEPATQNISTGEERTDPEADMLTHDDVRQAMADYAAKVGMPEAQKNRVKLMGVNTISAISPDQEKLRQVIDAITAATDAAADAPKPEKLTHDDVRDALRAYADKFGNDAAHENGPDLLGAPKISAIPEDQAALRKAVDAIRAAIEAGAA